MPSPATKAWDVLWPPPTYLQVAIHDGDAHVQSLLQELESCMDFDQPVHKDGTHSPVEFRALKVER